ncbi:MAG: hypothetical protein WCD76_15255 [Pyrinomonadaceae bacterium]
MEISELMTLLLLALIVATFWAIIPGLIAGWMMRETGKSFKWGCALGALGGPAGVLAALVIVGFSRRHPHAKPSRDSHGYYKVPVIGRLHVSTVWALAGIATFACVWVLGGLTYEFYRGRISPSQAMSASVNANSAQTHPAGVSSAVNSSSQQAGSTDVAAVAGKPSQADRQPLLNEFATQATRTTRALSVNSTQGLPSPDGSSQAVTTQTQHSDEQPASMHVVPRTPSQQGELIETAASPKPTTQAREAIVSQLTQALGARGYRVHAAFSGDAQTSTLSLSCATLTREVGKQLLGDSRTRAAMRASGIRIVVMINGQESWTYML